MRGVGEEIKQEANTWNRIRIISIGMQLVETCKQCSFFVSSILSRLYLNVVSGKIQSAVSSVAGTASYSIFFTIFNLRVIF